MAWLEAKQQFEEELADHEKKELVVLQKTQVVERKMNRDWLIKYDAHVGSSGKRLNSYIPV